MAALDDYINGTGNPTTDSSNMRNVPGVASTETWNCLGDAFKR